MDLSLSETQEMFKRTARDFLAAEFPTSLVRRIESDRRGYSPEVWQKMAELGWLSVPFPEQWGGLDGSLVDVAVLAEEMAQAAALSPYISTLLSGLLILRAGNDAQKERFLPKIAAGGLIISTALIEPSGSYEAEGIRLSAVARGDRYILNGTKLFVEYASAAQELICVARTRSGGPDATTGISLFIVPADAPGVTIGNLTTIGGDRQSEVVFDDVEVPKDRLVGQLHGAWPSVEWLLDVARALAAVELVGFGQKALDMTVDYIGYREAFGRPIGSFQVAQHHCANMAIWLEGPRCAAYEATWRLSKGLDARFHAAVAKASASNAGREVTMLAHQLHGGIGYMAEFDLHFYSRRAKGWELKWGTPDQLLRKVADYAGI
ncbi:MAG: acyl-CoA dehydrogenase family protein [Steroidobacteraceae bacterium]|jgi:alkylation response protein AidB-like acyl-CoA dehydrogenase|nr:acyl-CoA dehydrogenase family protein [Steroidobacteraceae bacterium]